MTISNESQELVFWASDPSWYTHEDGTGIETYRLTHEAPERAQKSFEAWKKHNNL